MTAVGTRAAVVAGIGGCVPDRVVSNDELAARLDTSDAWITSRTGIRQRHVVSPGTATSDLAVEAGARALKSAAVDAVDLVIVATTTPDHPCPACAPAVAERIGLGRVPAFDLNAVCSGFVYGLATAAGMLASGAFGSVLLIGADTFSTLVDPRDRATAFLFGDGAGAMVLRAGEPDEPGAIIDVELGSDGSQQDLIVVPAGGSRVPAGPDRSGTCFSMQGQAVYRNAVARMAEGTRSVLDRVGWSVDELDWFVGHQANQRIIDAVAARIGLSAERALTNLDRVGNTAAASIPLALADADEAGLLKAGQKIALAAFGGGATWGAAAMTWPDLP
jgi:3-oxoacyl-[acyl-carrier-protein] synthase III